MYFTNSKYYKFLNIIDIIKKKIKISSEISVECHTYTYIYVEYYLSK